MKTPVRFHLDESADGRIARGLRNRDRDCSISKEVDLLGAPDESQLAFAIQEKRVVITRDSDFTALVDTLDDHPGIIFWQSDDHFGQIIKTLDKMATQMTADEFLGHVFYL